jgi:ADP-ribosylation factor GTPase-activating protein 2/3
VITEVLVTTPSDGASTPAGEPDDDFFSSWDKPSIKRPSNPPSRTATPPVVSRTASPFLSAGTNGNETARPKSPLSGTDKSDAPPPPAAIRTAAAVRKGPSAGPKKGSVLGAKKAPKLGAKKITPSDAIDFEAAEKKAKEEAERIAKLGYDPEAEKAETGAKATPASATKIAAPTPVNPTRAGFGATRGHERTSSETERLGMGVARLGFGQVGGAKAPVPAKMGFGDTGPSKSVDGTFVLFLLRSPQC